MKLTHLASVAIIAFAPAAFADNNNPSNPNQKPVPQAQAGGDAGTSSPTANPTPGTTKRKIHKNKDGTYTSWDAQGRAYASDMNGKPIPQAQAGGDAGSSSPSANPIPKG